MMTRKAGLSVKQQPECGRCSKYRNAQPAVEGNLVAF